MADLLVVDLSHHNPTPDFAKAAANGLVGIIHKATEGTSMVDENYADRREAAVAAGLSWSSYHFLKHGNVEAQIAHYLDTVDPAEGERVCIDYEDEKCTLEDLRAAVSEIMEVDSTLQITVYGGHLIKEQLGSQRDDLLADNTSLWIAQYTSAEAPSWPKGTWPTWTLWQYSDGDVGGTPRSFPGFKPPFDCNRFNGPAENCRKWFGPASAQPEPQPEPEPAPEVVVVGAAFTVPEGVTLELSINGKTLKLLAKP